MSKKNIIFISIIIIIIVLTIATLVSITISNTSKVNENSGNQQVTISDIEYDYEDTDIEWKNSEYTDIKLNNKSVNITKAGTYHITGTIEDGNIMVNVNNTDLVRLILDNVSINCKDSSAINVESAKKVIIITAEDSVNTLIDGSSYSTQDEPDAALFSKDDLVITGAGTLNITGNYLDGIVSKDSLEIVNTTVNINANDDGIRGKDYVGIKNSNISVKANSDGVKATNDTDAEKGYIQIKDSKITIEAGEDGIQAETVVSINGGNFEITTGGGSQNSSVKEEWGMWSNKQIVNPMSKTTTSVDETSAKGIKGISQIIIEDGTFTIDSSDDSIHSNGIIKINGGVFEISSGDDGIHADESIVVNNGKFSINKSYEGIEASKIEINNGEISLVASDDGINVAGGNDSSSISGRPGQNSFSTDSDRNLTINGGKISINSIGDGIDINGSGYINGGTILVDGPSSDGNGALDYDGEFIVTAGTFIATGSNGMMQSPTSNSTQYSIAYVYSTKQESQSTVSLKNSDGEEIVSFSPSKNYACVVISSEKLKKNEKYIIYTNGEEVEEITVSNIVTTNGTNSMGMQPGMKQTGGKQPGGKTY